MEQGDKPRRQAGRYWMIAFWVIVGALLWFYFGRDLF